MKSSKLPGIAFIVTLSLAAVLLLCGVAAAQSAQLQGVINGRSGNTMTVQDQGMGNVVVVLTPDTQVEDVSGVFHARKKQMGVTALVPGLSVQVKGSYNAQNQVIADTVKFNSKALQTATDIQAGVAPVEQQTQQQQQEIAQQQAKLQAQEAQIASAQKQITQVNGEVANAQMSAKTALEEAEARRNDSILIRNQKAAVEKQANEFKLKQAELNDRIRELERILETATKHNTDLRERVAKFSALLRQNGLSDDISQIKGMESPPPVVGAVKRVDPSNRRVELSIGSDDGLVVGHELFLFRQTPRPEYLGKITIIAVDPDQAVGRVNGTTYQGKKIKEGDLVSSTIKPRI